MKRNLRLSVISLLGILLLVLGGCLVSGSFVVVENFSFSIHSGFYAEAIDLTDNDIWAEHADKLDEVEAIGFELWITNNSEEEWKFWGELDEYDVGCVTELCAVSSTTSYLIFDTLTIPAGSSGTSQKYVTYAESFNYLVNVDSALADVMSGQFNFYGYAKTGGGTVGGHIDSLKVVLTINASDS